MIRFAKLHSDAVTPTRKNPTDAGLDLYAYGDYIIKPHTNKVLHTGITLETPEGFMYLIKPKGRNNHMVGAGVVDAGYEPGEFLVKVVNYTDEDLVIRHGDGIAQAVLVPVITEGLSEVELDDLSHESSRSNAGGILGQATFFGKITDVD